MRDARARAAWLGWPLWGLAIAGIFLSYNAVGAAGVDLPWRLDGWLWVPWVLAGIAGSRLVQVSLDVEGPDWSDRSVWLSRLAGVGVFLGVDGILAVVPAPEGPNAVNLAFSGGVAAGLAVLQHVREDLPLLPGVAAGVAVIALAYALPSLVAAEVLRGLVSALAVAFGFLGVGVVGLAGLDGTR